MLSIFIDVSDRYMSISQLIRLCGVGNHRPFCRFLSVAVCLSSVPLLHVATTSILLRHQRVFELTLSFTEILVIFIDVGMSGLNMPAGPHENASYKHSWNRCFTARTKAFEFTGFSVVENMLQRAVSMTVSRLRSMFVAGVT
jgi:hypothetical protein